MVGSLCSRKLINAFQFLGAELTFQYISYHQIY